MNLVDEFVIYDDVQYTKRDWRNRNKIKTPQGSKWISVPVQVKGKYFQNINETMISEPDWAQSHWGSIKQNYSKAPFFKEYKDRFEELYMNMKLESLTEVNQRFMVEIIDVLGINIKIRRSEEFNAEGIKTDKLINVCLAMGATEYFTGPAAKSYIEEDKFESHNIKLHYLDYADYPEYNQLFPPFDHSVTILDLIFNEGPEAIKYMKNF